MNNASVADEINNSAADALFIISYYYCPINNSITHKN